MKSPLRVQVVLPLLLVCSVGCEKPSMTTDVAPSASPPRTQDTHAVVPPAGATATSSVSAPTASVARPSQAPGKTPSPSQGKCKAGEVEAAGPASFAGQCFKNCATNEECGSGKVCGTTYMQMVGGGAVRICTPMP